MTKTNPESNIVIDDRQKAAIEHTDGPLLVIAGPGAGKTATMVKRIAHLVLEKDVAPESIMVATFSRKAAKELVTRISGEFAGVEPPVNVNAMRIGTFHSLCRKILAEYAGEAGLKNFTVLDDYYQMLKVQHGCEFETARKDAMFCDWRGNALPPNSQKYALKLIECANTLAEECVDERQLADSGEDHAWQLADFIGSYRRSLARSNQLDFAEIQRRTLQLLQSNLEVLADLRKRIRYIIVDEYQDTSFIQEQIVLLLAGDNANVCVVGDDDQSLYRFRGATVQNILQFESNFGGRCKRIDLATNYRSQRGIVDFCKRWMNAAPGHEGDPSWDGCRYDKSIAPNPAFPAGQTNPTSVVRLEGANWNDWYNRTLQFIRDVQASPDFRDLNQIAFICSSLRSKKIQGLMNHLESNGLPVHAPRAGRFFERDEVQMALGCLAQCFPSCDMLRITTEWHEAGREATQHNRELFDWVVAKRCEHTAENAPKGGFDYGFSDLFFEMMQFEPFKGWLDQSDSMSVVDAKKARNLAEIAGFCARFEAAEDYPKLKGGRSVETMPMRFFSKYIGGLIEANAVDEYEDDREYAPSGHVSFMTVHQAKGMEFPIVVACTLDDSPWASDEPLVDVIRGLNAKRKELEPAEDRPVFDFWRKYYTAFSRAQDLLVLSTAGESAKWPDPSPSFEGALAGVPDVSSLDLDALRLREVKPANLLRSYSFTSDVAAYQACPRRYKLFHELKFPQTSKQNFLFGTLVHQCIEDIHRAVKRNRDAGENAGTLFASREAIEAIVSDNRASLEGSENAHLKSNEGQAVRQVMKYLKHSEDIWRDVIEPEAAVNEMRDGFEMKGVIDLIHGNASGVEIVDFKTGKMPPEGSRLLEKYRRQMQVYTHLARQQLGRKVTGAKLYFTGDDADAPVIDIAVTDEDVNEILQEFDSTVGKIEACDFSARAEDPGECKTCPFKHYCGRKEPDSLAG